ncbi:MAG: acetyl-CoA carboxylase biotin carboxyl carrier protein [Spirochaetaceae bacterium]
MELKDLFELVDKFEDSTLTELRIKTEDSSVVLKRGCEPQVVAPAAPQQPPTQASRVQDSTSAQASPAGGHEVESGVAGAEDLEYITAPIVATFYRSPAPDAPPFVEDGTRVKTGDVLCVLEAMKVMNELEAEFDLEIVRILVQNGEMVEYGTPIFEVKRL